MPFRFAGPGQFVEQFGQRGILRINDKTFRWTKLPLLDSRRVLGNVSAFRHEGDLIAAHGGQFPISTFNACNMSAVAVDFAFVIEIQLAVVEASVTSYADCVDYMFWRFV